jgi:hypothetical protein
MALKQLFPCTRTSNCVLFTCASREMLRLTDQQPKHHHPAHALQESGLRLHDSGQIAFQPVQNEAYHEYDYYM